MLHLFRGDPFRDGVQRIGVLLVPLVAGHIGFFRFLCFRGGEHLGLVEQEAHLLHDRLVGLLRRRAKLLVPGQPQSFR